MTANHLLSLSIWLPILAGVLVLATGNENKACRTRWMALVGAVLSFAVTVPLYIGFSNDTAAMQFVEAASWIPAFSINYHLGIDGISLWFVLLNSFMTVLVVIAGWVVIEKRLSQYMAAFLIMSGLINGVFAALDAILFYVFFEAMLIPMFLIIGIWGGPRRVYAALKFFLYTLLGSLLMLAAFIYLYFEAGGSFEIIKFQILPLPLGVQILLFLAFFMSFAVKVPMWPVHTWLPDAHVEAPTGGSVILAAITLKIGAYGFLRFNLPITPDASHALSGFMIALSLIAVVYIGLVALVQNDMKKLVAYSSIAHMGFVTLGIFMFNPMGTEGALLQMISHGFVSGAMFLCIGVLYDRMHSRQISDYGGVVNTMPVFAAFFMLFAMANAGLPGTSGFIGEFIVTLSAIQVNFWYAALAATTLIFGAA
ncbi:MAG: NADH-quinone oxidoreductase subunit M, partial [Burkholderiales bacterium]